MDRLVGAPVLFSESLYPVQLCVCGSSNRVRGDRYVDFGWITTWVMSASSASERKACVAYLMDHPEESDDIHVVM